MTTGGSVDKVNLGDEVGTVARDYGGLCLKELRADVTLESYKGPDPYAAHFGKPCFLGSTILAVGSSQLASPPSWWEGSTFRFLAKDVMFYGTCAKWDNILTTMTLIRHTEKESDLRPALPAYTRMDTGRWLALGSFETPTLVGRKGGKKEGRGGWGGGSSMA